MRTSFHHQSEAEPPNGPLTAATSPDTPSAPWAESLGKFRFYMQRFESRRPDRPVRL
jgi:hypothetical protein